MPFTLGSLTLWCLIQAKKVWSGKNPEVALLPRSLEGTAQRTTNDSIAMPTSSHGSLAEVAHSRGDEPTIMTLCCLGALTQQTIDRPLNDIVYILTITFDK